MRFLTTRQRVEKKAFEPTGLSHEGSVGEVPLALPSCLAGFHLVARVADFGQEVRPDIPKVAPYAAQIQL